MIGSVVTTQKGHMMCVGVSGWGVAGGLGLSVFRGVGVGTRHGGFKGWPLGPYKQVPTSIVLRKPGRWEAAMPTLSIFLGNAKPSGPAKSSPTPREP